MGLLGLVADLLLVGSRHRYIRNTIKQLLIIMRLSALIVVLIINSAIALKESVSVHRSYHLHSGKEPLQTKIAQILLIKQDKKSLTAQLSLEFDSIIESSAFKNFNDYAVLTFKTANSSMHYTINSNDVLQNYKQMIYVIVNHNGDVVGFNYFQEKLKKKEDKSSSIKVIKPEQGKDHIYTYTATPPKSKEAEAQEEQSFFSKYKWYLIGFGVVVYIMSNIDPEKMNEMGRQQQAR